MLRQLIYVLATGFILFFYSERLFWTTFRVGDSLPDMVITWFAYSAITFYFLAICSFFKIKHWYGALIAGAIYGWLVEGAVAGTLYGTEDSAPFPVSILCTAVSWHGMITVLAGWFLMRRVLHQKKYWETLFITVCLGIFWGLWATFLWFETPAEVTSVPKFLSAGLITTLLLILSYWLSDRILLKPLHPTWLGLGFCGLILAFFYSQQVIVLGLRPIILLPVLLLISCGLLFKYKRTLGEIEETVQPVKIPAVGYLMTLPMPLVAAGVYWIALQYRATWPPVHQTIYPVTIYLGGALLLISSLKILIGPRVDNNVNSQPL